MSFFCQLLSSCHLFCDFVLECILALHSLLHVNQWLSQFTEFEWRRDIMNTQIKASSLKNYSLDKIQKETDIEVCFNKLIQKQNRSINNEKIIEFKSHSLGHPGPYSNKKIKKTIVLLHKLKIQKNIQAYFLMSYTIHKYLTMPQFSIQVL